MQDKIKWYEEVISQDPGSNLFFPLARLYAENKEPDKAVSTLRAGLQKHPWHLEAKLLLIDILSRSGRLEEAGQASREITSLLQKHPLLWANWADRLEGEQEMELALAVRFLGLVFSGSKPDFLDIVNQGLKNLFPGFVREETGGGAGEPLPNLLQTEPPVSEEPASALGRAPEPSSDEAGQTGENADTVPPDDSWDREPGTAGSEAYQTRTMAEILSGQGDYDESIQIYTHLLQKTADAQERQELQACLERVEKLRETRDGETARPDAVQTEKPDRTQLIQELERLASRLERTE
ncbi:MAG: tetratricopeptide repeat protein [Desulfohalobiaceae bacterium]|nr:tetratricopeptide repeat protein [Desulfohalobiaceae bacterium]